MELSNISVSFEFARVLAILIAVFVVKAAITFVLLWKYFGILTQELFAETHIYSASIVDKPNH